MLTFKTLKTAPLLTLACLQMPEVTADCDQKCKAASEYCDDYDGYCHPCDKVCDLTDVDTLPGCAAKCPQYLKGFVMDRLYSIQSLQVMLALVIGALVVVILILVVMGTFLFLARNRPRSSPSHLDSPRKNIYPTTTKVPPPGSGTQGLPVTRLAASNFNRKKTLDHSPSINTVSTGISSARPVLQTGLEATSGGHTRLASEDRVPQDLHLAVTSFENPAFSGTLSGEDEQGTTTRDRGGSPNQRPNGFNSSRPPFTISHSQVV